MRTAIVKAKTVCTTYSKSEVTQGYLVALHPHRPAPEADSIPLGSGLQEGIFENKCNISLDIIGNIW